MNPLTTALPSTIDSVLPELEAVHPTLDTALQTLLTATAAWLCAAG